MKNIFTSLIATAVCAAFLSAPIAVSAQEHRYDLRDWYAMIDEAAEIGFLDELEWELMNGDPALAALLLPAVQQAREAALRNEPSEQPAVQKVREAASKFSDAPKGEQQRATPKLQEACASGK